MQNDILNSIAQNSIELAASMPDPMKKNFFIALNHLCSAALDIPTAYLQGVAKTTRAVADARVNVIRSIGDKIGSETVVPQQFNDKALEKFTSKIIGQQMNLDKIMQHAANNMKNKVHANVKTEEISEDWLNSFEEIAKLKTSEEMQLVFGKILSGEISNPGTFSLKTLSIVSHLEAKVAEAFMRLCSSCLRCTHDGKVLLSFFPSILQHHLNEFVVTNNEIIILKDYGLIHALDISYNFYEMSRGESLLFGIGRDFYRLIYEGDIPLAERNPLIMQVIDFSAAGVQLVDTLAVEDIDVKVFQIISDFFKSKDFKLRKI